MNNKGFTLMELITVLSILSLIALISIPKISEAFKQTRADQLESVRVEVMNAAKIYIYSECGKKAYDNLYVYKNTKIYLNSIVDCGLLDEKIYNPVMEEYFNTDNEYVDVTLDLGGYLDFNYSF